MSALPIDQHDPDEPTLALIRRLAQDVPITTLLEAWAERAGIGGSNSEVTLEVVFDPQGHVRRAIVHRKLGADQLDQMGD